MATRKFLLTPVHLRTALEHIHYEISQLVEADISTDCHAINNALLESRLVHTRALLDFFQNSKRSKHKGVEMDDVLSMDYGFAASEMAIQPIYKEKLNKDLAHLTYSRGERLPKEKYWPNDQVFCPVLSRSREFIEHVISTYLKVQAPDAISQWVELLNKVEGYFAKYGKPVGT